MSDEWKEAFYTEMDPFKRQKLLEEGGDKETEAFRKELWEARYGKRRPNKDLFIAALMQLKYLADAKGADIGGKRRREAARILNSMHMGNLAEYSPKERELLVLEMENTFLKYIEVSRGGRGFTSVLFGMGQLSDESVAKKLAEQISDIAFKAAHGLHMEKEFALIQEGALLAFRREYPNREHFLRK
jgi:hypothetical protein